MRGLTGFLAAALVSLGAAAPAVADGSRVASSEPPAAGDAIDWTPIAGGIEAGWLEVPIDHDDPSAGSFRLYVVRHRATASDRRIGTLLVNPGGPGFGGSAFARYASSVYSSRLLERFDIVGWDPRGVGRSTPAIDCIDDWDAEYDGVDVTPDDQAARDQLVAQAERFAEACATANATTIQHVGTNDSARDIDALRVALGEQTISYFGFSYGSELGATWATLFPDTVRAAVFDGATDPAAGLIDSAVQQAAGFEAQLDTFLADCAADSGCAFHNDGETAAAFDELMGDIDAQPLAGPIDGSSRRPDVNTAVAAVAVSEAMYSDALWPQLAEALASAQAGDGTGLLALFDAYYQRAADGTWDNSLEAYQTITCMDAAERPTVAEEDAAVAELQAASPRLEPATVGSYHCTFFPPAADPRIELTAAGAGPVVVCGVTGDPATPLAGTRRMAAALDDARLIVVDGEQHTCYGLSSCADDLIDSYLLDLVLPPPETRCSP